MLRINKLLIAIDYMKNGQVERICPTMKFTDGVNFIWDKGKNHVGKSTCINSIFYALGLEELLGSKGKSTMKHVLHKKIKIEEKEYDVDETYIYLEISNGERVVTICRAVKGEYWNNKLVRVFNLGISNLNKYSEFEEYYLHDSGAAQKEIGFHNFLEHFLKIMLPDVTYNNGESKKLYLQVISNLFFVEQIKGWTGFNVQKVYYGIKNVERVSIEYILGCKIIDRDKEKSDLKSEIKEKIEKWKWTKEKIENSLKNIGEVVVGIPETYEIFKEVDINSIKIDGECISSIKKKLIDEIDSIDKTNNKSIGANLNRIQEKMEEYSKQLEKSELDLENIKKEFTIKKVYHENLIEELEEVKLSIRRYEDIIKLRSLGSTKGDELFDSECPICGNKINDDLLPNDINIKVMDVDDNLLFIKDEKKIIESAIDENNKELKKLNESIDIKYSNIEKLREIIRVAKKDLVNLECFPSEDLIGRKYYLKEKLNTIMDIENEFEKDWNELNTLALEIIEKKKSLNNLPKSNLDKNDSKKVYEFQSNFRELLRRFGYASTEVKNISLSEDRYMPIADGFQLIYDSAGSDVIRAIWAYLLSLYMTAKDSGNHFGCFIFDEPFQQQVSMEASVEFINVLRKLGCQVIIATSLKEDDISLLTDDKTKLITIKKNFIELEENISRG